MWRQLHLIRHPECSCRYDCNQRRVDRRGDCEISAMDRVALVARPKQSRQNLVKPRIPPRCLLTCLEMGCNRHDMVLSVQLCLQSRPEPGIGKRPELRRDLQQFADLSV